MPGRLRFGVCVALATSLGCARSSPPGRDASGPSDRVVYDLARAAHAADAAFSQPFLSFGTPLTGANQESGFLSTTRGALGPAVEVERTSRVALRWTQPLERVAILDLEPVAGVSRGKLVVSLDERELARVALDEGRRRYAVAMPAAAQKGGGGRLTLHFEAGPAPARDDSVHAARLFSLAFGAATDPWLRRLAQPEAPPALAIAEDAGVPSLLQSGPSRLTYAFRVPPRARIAFRARAMPGETAGLRVAFDAGEGEKQLWSGAPGAPAPSTETSLALPAVAGSLARLVLEIEAPQGTAAWGRWEAPRVLGAAAGPNEPSPRADAAALARARPALDGANVVLIVLDAGSAKHFGCYGYPRRTTPEVDRIAAEGVVFERAHSTVPNTRVAMASIWTSQYPDENESGLSTRRRLPAERLRLAQVLSGHGVHTAGLVANANAEPGIGSEVGFQEYHRLYHGSGLVAAEAFRPLLDRFVTEAASRGRFFLYVHYKEPHVPYNPPPPYPNMFLPPGARPVSAGRAMRFVRTLPRKPYPRQDEIPGLIALYDGNLAYGDSEVGWLRRRLETAGLWERSVVIVTADHGEALGEHGFIGHNEQVYAESVRVPLVLRLPQAARVTGRRVRELVDHVDLAPTVLDLFGLLGRGGSQEAFRGTSLLPVALGAAGRGFSVSRSTGEVTAFAVHAEDHTLVLTPRSSGPPRSELFHATNDPEQGADLAKSDPLRTDFMRQELLRWFLALRPDRAASEPAAPLSPEAQENLRALGYVN